MLTEGARLRLAQLGMSCTSTADFANGLQLTELYIRLFHQGHFPELTGKMITKEPDKNGNRIININILVKHLQQDARLAGDPYLKQLSKFKLIEEQSEMTTFVEWLIKAGHEENKQEKSQDQLENLYFASQLEKVEVNELHDSFEVTERPVKKGSFKLIRPSSAFNSLSAERESQEHHPLEIDGEQEIQSKYQKQQQPIQQQVQQVQQVQQKIEPHDNDQLKELSMIYNPLNSHFSNNYPLSQIDENIQPRKTIPKMAQKPPLHPSANRSRQTTERSADKQPGKQEMKCSPYVGLQESSKRDQINRSIKELDKLIELETSSFQEEGRQLSRLQRIDKSVGGRSGAERVDIPVTPEHERRSIIQWLMGLGVLPSNAPCNELHRRCGTLLNEIVNYYRGRGAENSFFRTPKKSAELQSNYQKVFTYLQGVGQFTSPLLFLYEYFIPQPQERAFWALLGSMHSALRRKSKTRDHTNVSDYTEGIKRKLQGITAHSSETRLSSRKETQELKGNCLESRKSVKSLASNAQVDAKPQRSSKLAYSDTYYSELVQNQEPNDIDRGYKELYLSKFKQSETPKKATPSKLNTSGANSSSRVISSRVNSSVRKPHVPPALPAVSLQMQMEATRYINEYMTGQGISQTQTELMRDPLRNGVLLNELVIRQLKSGHSYCLKPKSIEDIRDNFKQAFRVIRKELEQFPSAYVYYCENIIKGESSLLFGAVWHIMPKQPQLNVYRYQSETNFEPEDALMWVRSLEQESEGIAQLRIRDNQALVSAMINGRFLYCVSELITQNRKVITPVYERPSSLGQVEANLKKALGYFVQTKMVRSDLLLKTKQLVKGDSGCIQELIHDLMHAHRQTHPQQFTFVKYLQKESRLETTMANQTQPFKGNEQNEKEQHPLEIAWIRKLGFDGDLSLSNGVLLCRLMSRLAMKTIRGVIDHPNSKAECLSNIRKALREIPKCRWDEQDILSADRSRTQEIYAFIKDKYRHCYAMKSL